VSHQRVAIVATPTSTEGHGAGVARLGGSCEPDDLRAHAIDDLCARDCARRHGRKHEEQHEEEGEFHTADSSTDVRFGSKADISIAAAASSVPTSAIGQERTSDAEMSHARLLHQRSRPNANNTPIARNGHAMTIVVASQLQGDGRKA